MGSLQLWRGVLEREESNEDPDKVEELSVNSNMERDKDEDDEEAKFFPIHHYRKRSH